MGTSRSSLKGCGFPIIKVKNRKDGKKGTEKSCSSNRAPSSSASVSVSKGSSGGSDIKSKAGGRKPGLHPPAPAANGSSAKGTVVHRRTQEATGVASRKRNVNEKSSKEGGSTSRPAAGRTEGGSRDEGKERPPSGIAPQRSSWAKQNLPGGAASIGTGTSRAPPSTSRRSKGANSRRGTSSSASSTIGADRRSSSSFSSYLMTLPPSRPGSRGHPASRCDSAGQAGRQSFRMRRQPSTYGELHEIVAGQKLGSGAARGLVGLQNLGNTCFMNSALQCLVNCEALVDYFLGFDWPAEINRANILGQKGLMAEALGKLANQMWCSEKASLRPSGFKRQVGESMPLFAGYEQQDVQEFLAFLLDAVHEDLNRVPNADRKYVEAPEAKKGQLEEMVAMEAWKGYLELRSALQCGVCGRRSVTFDPFMYLTVPLPEDGEDWSAWGDEGGGGRKDIPPGGVPLEACIRRFCETETLKGDNCWYCPSCKKHQPATKKLDLWKVPPVLIVHLKRFAGSVKILSEVIYPLTGLNLSEVVKSPQREAPDYDLYATANHHGSVHGGHYTAAARNRVSGEWNLFNDERVEGLEPNEVQTPSAYVLFYTKMSTVEEAIEEEVLEPEIRDQHQPPRHAAEVGGVADAGGVGLTAGLVKSEEARRGVGTREKNRPGSPKRAAAIVRRQSVSKPYNWPHMQAETFEPSFKPALEPTETVAMDIVSSADAALFAANSTGGASDGPNLERAEAEQGHSRAPGSASTSVPDGVALPKIGKHSAVDGNEAAVSANSSGVVGATRGRVRKPPR